MLFNDFVGFADPKDYYRFNLNVSSDFSAVLYNLSDHANLRLYRDDNSNGILENSEVIVASTNGGILEDSINLPLTPGNYFVLVDNGAVDLFSPQSDTPYKLSLSAVAPASTIISNVNLLNKFKTLSAESIIGGTRRQTLDLSFQDDKTQLFADVLIQYPGGVRGFDGNDTIGGSASNDAIYGNVGADLLVGNGGDDILLGGRDNDQIFAGDGDDIVNGNLGDDSLDGAGGDDILRGNRGNDVLAGGDGNDFLCGDFGTDTLIGGNGADVFVFRTETEAGNRDVTTADKIFDFVFGQDKVAIVGNVGLSNLVLTPADTNTIVQLGTTGDILGVFYNASVSNVANSIFIAPLSDSFFSL